MVADGCNASGTWKLANNSFYVYGLCSDTSNRNTRVAWTMKGIFPLPQQEAQRGAVQGWCDNSPASPRTQVLGSKEEQQEDPKGKHPLLMMSPLYSRRTAQPRDMVNISLARATSHGHP